MPGAFQDVHITSPVECHCPGIDKGGPTGVIPVSGHADEDLAAIYATT